MKTKVPTAEEMLAAGVHYGHKSRHWHPKMEKYIHTNHNGVHIVDLYKTREALQKAMEVLFETAKLGKRIIFVGTKEQCKQTIETEAKNSGALYITERWFGGTLTNFDEIKRNRDELVTLKKQMEDGGFKDLTKKERLLISRKIEKLEKMHGGLVGLNDTPGAVVVVDARREKTAVSEANKTGVPIIALVDTNTDPSSIDYTIAGNDDAIKSVALVVRALGEAVAEGSEQALKSKPKEE
jgi:small subunit ribosomal protein S2